MSYGRGSTTADPGTSMRSLSDDVDLLERGSLPAAWSDNWRAEPTKTVLYDVDGSTRTGAQLLEATAHIAGRLHGAGLRRGDRILLSGEASADFVIAHCAALRLGLVVVPVNTAFSRREVEVIVGLARPKAAIVENRSGASGCPTTCSSPASTSRSPNTSRPNSTWRHRTTSPCCRSRPAPRAPPRVVLLTHGNLLASAESVRRRVALDRRRPLILCLPLFHMHGLGVGIHGSLLRGRRCCCSAASIRSGARRVADATMFFGVPTMYARLVGADGADRLAALRLCVSGSAPLAPTCTRRCEQRTGPVGARALRDDRDASCSSRTPYEGERRPGTVGLPLPGVELRLEADSGEILVRGPNVFASYLDLPDATAEAFTRDGFFRTGDIGELDEAGYLRIVGRAKELIITGGYNVYPREVEDVLRSPPVGHRRRRRRDAVGGVGRGRDGLHRLRRRARRRQPGRPGRA